jgi:hypothetical protein
MAIFDEPSRQPLPQPTFEDFANAGRKALVAMIPVLGAAGSELMGLLSSPVTLRRDAWLEDLARRLRDLEYRFREFRFDNLDDNERFVSATLHATQAALRSHQKEKLEALRNAVLNTAIGVPQSADYDTVFLSLIERFAPSHLKALAAFAKDAFPPRFLDAWVGDDPSAPGQADFERRESVFGWVRTSVPDLAGEDEGFIQAILTDLFSAGLTTLHPEIRSVTADRLGGTATEFGRQFLRFITSPLTTGA